MEAAAIAGKCERRGVAFDIADNVLPTRAGADASNRPATRDLCFVLEREGYVAVEAVPFRLAADELDLTDRKWSDGRSKNISFDRGAGRVDGAISDAAALQRLRRLMERYSEWSTRLIADFFPTYHPHVELGRTSFRPRSVRESPRSLRKDDRRLHVDAFPSQPVAGRQILRVFSNVDPAGASREWAIGGGFEEYAQRFRGRARRLFPGEAALLERLTLTKSRRSDYDQIMLTMHDAAKSDLSYQRTAPRRIASFPGGCSWVAFTDQSPHAAISGNCALEQTFYLPIKALHEPACSPLSILERMYGRPLA